MKRPSTFVDWTPERVEELRACLERGLSYAETAKVMKIGKNAVLGKTIRAGFRKVNLNSKPRLGPVINTVAVNRCRFIAGDPKKLLGAGKTFDQIICGKPVKYQSSLCPDHHAVYWIKPPKRNRKPFVDLQSAPRDLPKERAA